MFIFGTHTSKFAWMIFPGVKMFINYSLTFSIIYSQMEVYTFLLNNSKVEGSPIINFIFKFSFWCSHKILIFTCIYWILYLSTASQFLCLYLDLPFFFFKYPISTMWRVYELTENCKKQIFQDSFKRVKCAKKIVLSYKDDTKMEN